MKRDGTDRSCQNAHAFKCDVLALLDPTYEALAQVSPLCDLFLRPARAARFRSRWPQLLAEAPEHPRTCSYRRVAFGALAGIGPDSVDYQ
jgi:hypothetical protein